MKEFVPYIATLLKSVDDYPAGWRVIVKGPSSLAHSKGLMVVEAINPGRSDSFHVSPEDLKPE